MDPIHSLIAQLDALIEAVSAEVAGQVRIAEEAERHLSQPTPPTGVDVAFLLAAPTAAVPALETPAPIARAADPARSADNERSADKPRTARGVDTRVVRPVVIPPVAPITLEPQAPAPLLTDPAPETVAPPAVRRPIGRPRTMREALLA